MTHKYSTECPCDDCNFDTPEVMKLMETWKWRVVLSSAPGGQITQVTYWEAETEAEAIALRDELMAMPTSKSAEIEEYRSR